jgi:hypothetical protein
MESSGPHMVVNQAWPTDHVFGIPTRDLCRRGFAPLPEASPSPSTPLSTDSSSVTGVKDQPRPSPVQQTVAHHQGRAGNRSPTHQFQRTVETHIRGAGSVGRQPSLALTRRGRLTLAHRIRAVAPQRGDQLAELGPKGKAVCRPHGRGNSFAGIRRVTPD